jgi:hypothetical protein
VLFVNNTTNRATVIQGGQYTFQAALLTREGGTPQDPDGYPLTLTEPSATVYDPDGSPVSIGVGIRISQGIYSYLFSCPIGGVPSDGWYIKFGATIGGVYYEWQEFFTVVDRTVAQPKPQDPNQLSSLKTDEYVLALTNRTERVVLNIRVGTKPVQPVLTPTLSVYDTGEKLLATLPVSGIAGYTGSYYADVPGTLINQLDHYYMLVWTYMLTPAEPSRTLIQTLWTAPLSLFQALPDLRSVMDKAQKPTDRVQGYSDQEMARYLRQGLNLFNMRPPKTKFTFTQLPDIAYPWVIQCALLYGLKAQLLLEVDQDFEASGQTISLRWQHFANLSQFVQQAAQEWQDQGEKVKIALGLPRGRLYISPVVQGVIQLAKAQLNEGTFLEAYKI